MHKQFWTGAATAAAVLAVGSVAAAAPWKVQSTGKLTDLSIASPAVTDGAQAHVTAEEIEGGGTRVRLLVTGFDHDAVGNTYGAHVHVGTCVENTGGAAGGHYNHDGGPATELNEVWLDLTVRRGGIAETIAEVPFAIPAGAARSVVVHAQPTATDGSGFAGARLACLPVDF